MFVQHYKNSMKQKFNQTQVYVLYQHMLFDHDERIVGICFVDGMYFFV